MGATAADTAGSGDLDLAALVKELADLVGDLLPEQAHEILADGLRRLEQGRFHLVVVGEFKRGKSSLVNALLGEDVLPTGVVPTTSGVIVVRRGARRRLLVGFADEERERPLDELATVATEDGNPRNVLGVTSIVVEVESRLLADGLCLIDTPGLGSTHLHNTEATMRFVPRADAALVVLAADQPLGSAERELIAQTAEFAPHLVFALNRVDLLDEEGARAARRFVLNGITDEGRRGGADIFSVSARTGDGVAELAAYLEEIARRSGRSLTVSSVRAAAARVADEAGRVAALERTALELPLAELDRRRRLFEQRIAALQAARAESTDVLDAATSRLLDEEVGEPLRALPGELGPRLVERLEEWARERPQMPKAELASALRDQIDEMVREVFTREAVDRGAKTSAAIGAIERTHAARVESLLDDLDLDATFDAGLIVERLRATGLREPSRFTFKLEDPEHMLELALGRARLLAPGPLGRRLVLRAAGAHLRAMVDRHAGRLRSELYERARAAVAGYSDDLAAAIAEAAAEIAAAADRARAERGDGARQVATHLRRLEQTGARLDRIARQLDRGEDPDPDPSP